MTGSLLLALACSLAYGAADFLGGLAARGAHVLRVVLIAAPASLLVEVVVWPVFGASFTPRGDRGERRPASRRRSRSRCSTARWRSGRSACSRRSPRSCRPRCRSSVGLIGGESFGGVALVGMALALVAVVLVSGGTDASGVRPGRAALILAFGAGAAIALQLVCLDRAPDDSGVAPLLVGRAVSSSVVLGAAIVLRARLGDTRPSLSMSFAGRRAGLAGQPRVPAGRPRRRSRRRRGHHRAVPGRHRPARPRDPGRAHRAYAVRGARTRRGGRQPAGRRVAAGADAPLGVTSLTAAAMVHPSGPWRGSG